MNTLFTLAFGKTICLEPHSEITKNTKKYNPPTKDVSEYIAKILEYLQLQ